MTAETVKAEIRATDGSLSFEGGREVTLDEVRRMVAMGEALGVPTDAVLTDFSMRSWGADRWRFELRWQARREPS